MVQTLLPLVTAAWVVVAPSSPPAPILDPSLEVVRASEPTTFAPRPAAFDVVVDGIPIPHAVLAVTVLAGATVEVVAGAQTAGSTRLRYAAGEAVTLAEGRWRWTAPEGAEAPGVVPVVVEADGVGSVHLNVLVARPASLVRDGELDGYKIGGYQQIPLRGDPAYLPPTGFVQVSAEDENVLVSPHFTLGAFLCKQAGEPRFLAVSTPLILKLEAILEVADARGIEAPGLTVMSGFRTPWYNRAIGNTTDYSRHLWGDAADVYVDADRDGEMDDLDRNGRVDLDDARLLASVVDEVERTREPFIAVGGMGLYRRNAVHGPFVHVDARGTRARW